MISMPCSSVRGNRRYMDFCDRQFEVWEKNYRFVFIVSCSGFDYWTVELEGCPDYLEFMTRYFIPLLRLRGDVRGRGRGAPDQGRAAPSRSLDHHR